MGKHLVSGRKIFVVSDNKCGTTSLRKWAEQLGLNVGDQVEAEELVSSQIQGAPLNLWAWRNYISKSTFFQDVPFSNKDFLPHLASLYPREKYIYVTRDAEDWYRSLISHHIYRYYGYHNLVLQEDGSPLWTAELEGISNTKTYRGLEMTRWVTHRYGTSAENPYEKRLLCNYHQSHLEQARKTLPKLDSLFIKIEELSSKRTARKVAKFIGHSGRAPIIEHTNQG